MFTPQTRYYFQTAQGYGALAKPPTHQSESGAREAGHYFQVQLRVEADQIVELAFHCPRCLPAIACGGYLHQTLVNQTVDRAAALTSQEVLAALGGLPLTRSFYAWMACDALHRALGDPNADHPAPSP